MSTKPDGEILKVIITCNNFYSSFSGSLNPRPSKIREKKSASAFTHFIKATIEGKSVAFRASEKKSKV